MKLQELDDYLKSKLDLSSYSKDLSLNGVQVACSNKEIKRVGFCVDASYSTFKKAIESGCDMLFVHHGLFWGSPIAIKGAHYDRIKLLLDNDVALYACHLPLDAHPVYGNNAQMMITLGIREYDPFGSYHQYSIGYKGAFKTPKSLDEIVKALSFDKENGLKLLPFGKEMIKTVGIVSGGASTLISEAIDDKLDLYITGEVLHQTYHEALEHKINVISGGHYMSETYGVKAVMRLIKAELGIDGVFIECPTTL